jgi:hypothetical protein
MAEHRKPARNALQLTLFEIDEDGKSTNTIDLYDIAPRFVFYTSSREAGRYLDAVTREFEHAGKKYVLTLKPARVIRPDGSQVDEFPGEREQIVEEVLRRLAVERGRLELVDNDTVLLRFSLNEIRAELERVHHSHRLDEIKEALMILHGSIVEIVRIDQKTTKVLSSSAFPVLALRSRDDEDGETCLQFNPLVARALRQLEFRQVSYECLMRIGNPLSRWLYKRLCQNVAHGGEAGIQSIAATEIARDSGMSTWSRWRDALRHISEAVDTLVCDGVLSRADRDIVQEGRRKADIIYHMHASPEFLAQLHRAERFADDNRRELARATGGAAPERFVLIDASAATGIRKRRSRQMLLEQQAVES